MKLTIAALLFALSHLAYGGSTNCTSPTTSVTASGDYYAQASDCFISVDKTFFEFTYVYLPENPSIGDEFNIWENTTAEECDEWSCHPAGVGVESLNVEHLIYDEYGAYTIFTLMVFRDSLKVTFNGVGWDAVYGSH